MRVVLRAAVALIVLALAAVPVATTAQRRSPGSAPRYSTRSAGGISALKAIASAPWSAFPGTPGSTTPAPPPVAFTKPATVECTGRRSSTTSRCNQSAPWQSRRAIRTSSGPVPERKNPQPHSVGQGVYKSTDAGASWKLMGLDKTGRIPRTLIHPTNPDIVFVCALGHSYGDQPERGVYRTLDGGVTWTRTLFVDEKTGCSDLAMDPSNPGTIFAECGSSRSIPGGDRRWTGSGLFVSRDGGATWTRQIGNGLPASPVGKVAVAIARSIPSASSRQSKPATGFPGKVSPPEPASSGAPRTAAGAGR